MTTIVSERLVLRTLALEDVTTRYVDWLNDPDVTRFLETRFAQQTRESCEQFVSNMNQDPCSHLFGIFEKGTLEHIGNIKLGFVNTVHKRGQVSLFIGEKSCWGKGYGTEAIKTITRWGFDALGLERIEAGCYETNKGSLRAFAKAGYSIDGFCRNSVVFEDRRIGCYWLGILKNEQAA